MLKVPEKGEFSMFLKTLAMLAGIVVILHVVTRNTYLLATKTTVGKTRMMDALLIMTVWFFTIVLTIIVLGDLIVQMRHSDNDLYVAALLIAVCALGVVSGYESGSGKDMTNAIDALYAFGCFAAIMHLVSFGG